MIDGGVAKLFQFILFGIPRKMDEIRAASVAPVVNAALLPNYDDVWTELYREHSFREHNFAIPWCDARTFDGPLSDHDGSVTNEEIDRVLMGDDGIDPISFWGFPGAPKELFDLARKQEKSILDNRILDWEDCCSGGDDADESEDHHGALPPGLDMKEVAFGEDAFLQD